MGAQRTGIYVTVGVQEEFLGKIMFEWSFERQKSKLNKWKGVFHVDRTACIKK